MGSFQETWITFNNLCGLELNSEVTLSAVSFIIIYNSYCPINWAFFVNICFKTYPENGLAFSTTTIIIANNINIRKQNNTTDAKVNIKLIQAATNFKNT